MSSPLLRLARRDALRHKGRSVLVLVLIMLPVLAVTAAAVVIATSQISGSEVLSRRLGTADARITVEAHVGKVLQNFDPDQGTATGGDEDSHPPLTISGIEKVLGHPVVAIAERTLEVGVVTPKGIARSEATEIDLRSPLARGLFRLTDGTLPRSPHEVVINRALADRGFRVGSDLTLRNGATRTVVGMVESTSFRGYPTLVGPLGSLVADKHASGDRTWLISGGPVSWAQVQKLNNQGATVLSRAVLENPPPRSELSSMMRTGDGARTTFAIAALIAVMALIEVVLLAGPAFAVGARRQQRTIALLASCGATPRQARRLVLTGALVLGSGAAAIGAVAGIGVGWAVLPLAQHFNNTVFGPFDVPWLPILGVMVFGLLSALLAAVVPARIAARNDVVAVLSGRRGDPRPRARSPILGLLLLGAGVAIAVYGAKQQGGEVTIAVAAIVAVLGMILLVPAVLAALARLSHRLPLVLRFALRDANRHRTRTVPAVAAVAATVCGVVALGIANTSDEAQNRATYSPSLPMGTGAITAGYDAQHIPWPEVRAAAARYLPDARLSTIRGVPSDEETDVELSLRADGHGDLLSSYGSALNTSVLVSESQHLPAVLKLSASDRIAARKALHHGGAVVFTDHVVRADRVRVGGVVFLPDQDRPRHLPRVTVPAHFVQVGARDAQFQAVLSPGLAHRLGVPVKTVGLYVAGGTITRAAEKDASEAVVGVAPDANFHVERGYESSGDTKVLLLVLGALGAILMLGGTLTATFLALSDAGPDLATLSAVGASPRTRRGVAAAYALVVGLVGALLGAVVGFVPGVAVSWPLTHNYGDGGATHYLDVPWLFVAVIVIGLPLLTTAVVCVTARARLPLVARQE